MSSRITLELFSKLEPHLPGRVGSHGGVARDNHNFLNDVFFIAKMASYLEIVNELGIHPITAASIVSSEFLALRGVK